MFDGIKHYPDRKMARRQTGGLPYLVATTLLTAALAASYICPIQAAECPATRQPRIPLSEAPVLNIDKHKEQLTSYQAGEYEADIGFVIDDARAYIEKRLNENQRLASDQLQRLAIVLDIDETSLTNWTNIKINNFGFIKGGSCTQETELACGFDAWILKATAPAIKPTREFFKFAFAKSIPVFFITGRRDSQRVATMTNLDREGFEGWAGLRTRPDNDHGSIVPFKSGERTKLMEQGFTIVANIGDQQSDLDGGSAECGFKLPNPFYFIK